MDFPKKYMVQNVTTFDKIAATMEMHNNHLNP
jgi:hypothetical protein